MTKATTAAVEQFQTYFDCEGTEGNFVHFTTRENGDVGEEEPGDADIEGARELRKALKACFGDSIKVTGDICDEWVNVTVEVV